MRFREVLGTKVLFADGAMGTMLQQAGLAPGEMPLFWNTSHAEVIRNIHADYLRAGAQVITANTFNASTLMLTGDTELVLPAVRAGIKLALEAVAQSEKEAWVALNIGPLGQFLEPLGPVEPSDASAIFSQQAVAGAQAGADLVLIETMIDLHELELAVCAVKDACDLPLVATVALGEQGRMLTGARIAEICALLEDLGVDALGANCGAGPKEIAPFLAEFKSHTMLPLAMSPNAGLPTITDGKTTYNIDTDEFASLMMPLVEQYAALAGGCCGTTPAHIEALVTHYAARQ